MRHLLWLLILCAMFSPRTLWAQVQPYGTPIACNHSAYYDASTSGATQLVAAISGKSVYVCGYQIVFGGTVALKFVQGTGTNCGTGIGTLTPAFSGVAQTAIGDASPYWRGLTAAAGNALCINASTGVAAQVIVYYAQF